MLTAHDDRQHGYLSLACPDCSHAACQQRWQQRSLVSVRCVCAAAAAAACSPGACTPALPFHHPLQASSLVYSYIIDRGRAVSSSALRLQPALLKPILISKGMTPSTLCRPAIACSTFWRLFSCIKSTSSLSSDDRGSSSRLGAHMHVHDPIRTHVLRLQSAYAEMHAMPACSSSEFHVFC